MHRGITVSWRCWARHPRPHCFGLGALDPVALGVLQVEKMQEGKPHPWTCRCALSVGCPGQDFVAVLDGAGISGGDASVGRCRAPMEAATQLPARFCSLGAARGRPERCRGSHLPPPGSPPGGLGGAAPATSTASGVCAPWPRGQSSNPWGLLLLRDPHPCCLPGGASREHHAARDTLGTPLSPCSPHHLLTHPPGRRSPLSQGTHRGSPSPAAPPGAPRCAQHPQLSTAHLSTLGTVSSCHPELRGIWGQPPHAPSPRPPEVEAQPPRSCSSGSLVCFSRLLPVKSPGTAAAGGGHSQGIWGRIKGAPWGLSPQPPSPLPPGAQH